MSSPHNSGGAVRPSVLIFRTQLFKPSETFIANQAAGLTRYSPFLLGRQVHGEPDARVAYAVPGASGPAQALYLATGYPNIFLQTARDVAPAVVHAHFGVDALYAAGLTRSLGRPLVTTLHGYDVTRRRGQFLMSGRPALMRYAAQVSGLQARGDLFLCVSEFIRQRALRYGYPESRLKVHHIGIDASQFSISQHDKRPYVLHIARLVEKKGTRYLLQAYAKVASRHPEAQLLIAGDGPLRNALMAQVESLGIAQCVRFLGTVKHTEIRRLLADAAVVVIPSVTAADGDAEGLPTVGLEAAASGVPVVASNHAGLPEAVIDGETGYITAEADVAAMAERLDALLTDEALRRRLGQQARAFVERHFDLRQQTALLENHYDSVK